MTPEQEIKFNEMENDISTILKGQAINSQKLDEVLSCLKGNSMGEDGLIKRIHDLEESYRTIKEERIAEGTQTKIQTKIIVWLVTIIGALIIAYVFNQALNHGK